MGKLELMEALRAHHVQLNQAAEILFEDGRFVPMREGMVIEIAFVSVGDLGFQDGATYEQLNKRAREIGLAESPLDLGPHLRLQFLHQPEVPGGSLASQHRAPPGSITVASAPLDESEETPKGFYLRRVDGALWLRGYRAPAEHVWSPEDVFVFSRSGGSGMRDSR